MGQARGRDVSSPRQSERDDVVAVRIVVDPLDPGRIRRARVRKGGQRREDNHAQRDPQGLEKRHGRVCHVSLATGPDEIFSSAHAFRKRRQSAAAASVRESAVRYVPGNSRTWKEARPSAEIVPRTGRITLSTAWPVVSMAGRGVVVPMMDREIPNISCLRVSSRVCSLETVPPESRAMGTTERLRPRRGTRTAGRWREGEREPLDELGKTLHQRRSR